MRYFNGNIRALIFCKHKAGSASENLNTKSAGSDAMVSSNTFDGDCISNVSDRSPDSDSERDSGSMIVPFAEFQFDSD